MTLAIASSLLPVLALLGVLRALDSFKLVSPRAVLLAIAAGGLAAFACMPLHVWLLDATDVSPTLFSRYVAPLTEETAKAAYVVWLVGRRRVGFPVDAAILGFGVGTGFALVENVEYLRALQNAVLTLWIVRGFGTAILHGATTATLAMLTRNMADRHADRTVLNVLPGWGAAVTLHSVYNHTLVTPVVATAVLLVGLPFVVLAVFERSERATREWVGEGLDLDVELLRLVTSPVFAHTRLGAYLQELRDRFSGPVVADMFCLLRLELELSVRAKGMLMAREAGLDVPVDDDLSARLEELQYLRTSIGRTGLLALEPLQVSSHRDDWHRYLLREAGAHTAGEPRKRRGSS